MVTIIGISSSIVLLILFITFLPLGFTLKGKFLIVLSSFIISLGGLAAVSTFPYWETALMLVVLCFFVAYFMHTRLGIQLYLENQTLEQKDVENGTSVSDYPFDNNDNLLEIKGDAESSKISIKDALVGRKNEFSLSKVKNVDPGSVENDHVLMEEDISFLVVRNDEFEENEQMEQLESNQGDLSDIESLLAEDLFLATKEAALGQEDIFEEIDTKNKISLQK